MCKVPRKMQGYLRQESMEDQKPKTEMRLQRWERNNTAAARQEKQARLANGAQSSMLSMTNSLLSDESWTP